MFWRIEKSVMLAGIRNSDLLACSLFVKLTVLWNLKFQYYFHSRLSLVITLNQILIITALPTYLFNKFLMLCFCLCLGLPTVLFPACFPSQTLYAVHFSYICATCCSQLMLLDLINLAK